MNPSRVLGLVLAASGVSSLSAVPPQQAAKEYDLTWRLPHDRAAVYEVFDGTTGARREEFWLLGCELERRVGATDTRDLPFRYIFRRPKAPIKVGSQWEVREIAFEGPERELGVSPLEVVGLYRLRQVKSIRLNEQFKTAFRNIKDKSALTEVALIDAQFDFFRCNKIEGKGAVRAEQKASATLAITIATRPSDGAVLAARYHWSGREESYSVISNPGTKKSNEVAEIALREPFLELNKEALKGKIDLAVEKGVKYLKSIQAKDGRIADNHYPVGSVAGIGATAMSVLALLHSGMPIDDPSVKAGLSYISSKKVNQSYDLALCLMALEAKYLPLGTMEEVEKFSEKKAREDIRKRITKEDIALATEMTRAVIETQSEYGMFGYVNGGGLSNLSSTQYAILGLKSASRMGIYVPASVWRQTLSFILKSAMPGPNEVTVSIHRRDSSLVEHKSRPYGWVYEYQGYPSPTGTLTEATLRIIAICESELARLTEWKESDSKTFDELAWGAAAWIQENYGIRATPPEGCNYAASMVYYYLYGLERAAILWELDKIGGHDWFMEGTALILSWQKPDGSWSSRQASIVIDTAWALLFLKRATIPVETGRPRIASVDKSPKATEPQERP